MPNQPDSASVRHPFRNAQLFVALGLAAALLGSSAPSPLYSLYQAQWSLSATVMTLIFAIYAFGVLPALLIGGRLADRVSDTRTLLGPALVCVMVGSFVFAGLTTAFSVFIASIVLLCGVIGWRALVQRNDDR